ncbi:glycosyltransferase family 4 protein [Gammaproteobacteria bacterium]|nr:glycosyltransferase family 4 protein [Gammaproteobacteria bacterium]
MSTLKLLYIINVDWYFLLHWLDRAAAAKNAGYEVHIAMTITDKKTIGKLENLGFFVHDIPIRRKSINPLKELSSIIAIYRLISQKKPDIVHSVTIKPNIYAGTICRLKSIPCASAITGLGTTFSSRREGARKVAQQGIKKLYQVAFGGKRSLVLFENGDDLNIMVNGNVITKAQAIHIHGAGVCTSHYHVVEAPDAPPIKVLFAARLLKNKGLHTLVNAIKKLKQDGLDINLLVAGIIDDDALGTIPIKQLEQWDSQSYIQWLGQVDDMFPLISSAHIVCLPTQYGEGVPRILIEGAACGRPLVATDVPGCREIVIHGQSGLLVTPGSENELAAALTTLINEPKTRDAMGKRGRNLVEGQYSSEIVIEKTLAAYRQALSL